MKSIPCSRSDYEFDCSIEVAQFILRCAYKWNSIGCLSVEDLAQDCLEHILRYCPENFVLPNWVLLKRVAFQSFYMSNKNEKRKCYPSKEDALALLAQQSEWGFRSLGLKIILNKILQRTTDIVVIKLLTIVLQPEDFCKWQIETGCATGAITITMFARYLGVSIYIINKAANWIAVELDYERSMDNVSKRGRIT